MKKKLLMFTCTAIALVCALTAALAGCKKVGGLPMVDENYLADYDSAPAVTAYYKSQFDEMMSEYNLGSIDASRAAAIMWALGSYNIGQAEQVVYFQNKLGQTSLSGKSGKLAYQQYHKERRRNESGYVGEKFHYTIKHVYDSQISSIYESFLESARVRLVVNDRSQGFDKYGLYRFEKNGDTTFTGKQLFGQELMTTEWKKGSDFGKEEEIWKGAIVPNGDNSKSCSEVIDAISAQLNGYAVNSDGIGDRSILGNINILKSGIVSSATITPANSSSGAKYYKVVMQINLENLNKDRSSTAMLADDNSAESGIKWTKMNIAFEIWDGGLMRCYTIDEGWEGTIKASIAKVSGEADAVNKVFYSYSDGDTSFTAEHKFLKDYIANN